MPQVPAIHRARQVGGVAVPVEQVKGRRLLALEVVADHVVPDQVVRPQEAEGRGQLATRQQLRATGRLGAERGLAHAHQSLIDKDVEHAVVAEVDQRGQQGDRGSRMLPARRQHCQRRGQQGAADAKAQGVELPITAELPADLAHHAQRLDHAVLDVVIPGQALAAVVGVAPADDEDPMALRDRIADQRVLGLEVEDVVLADAGRHQQEGARVDGRRERRVLDELEERVLEHHAAGRGGHVAAHLEGALVRLRDMAAPHVIQQVLKALGQGLATAVQRQLQRLGIEREEVAGRAASTNWATAKRMRSRVLASASTASAIWLSVRPLSR